MNAQALIEAALEAGATKAALISQSQIVLSATFREICEGNGCGGYNRCWMCPPNVGGIEELMARVRAFPRGLLYQTVARIEDSFDIEGMTAATVEHAQVSQRLEKKLRPRLSGASLHLTCGGCRLCDRCTKLDGLPCRHPEDALPSLEAHGIDVYNTTKDTDLRYINGANTVTLFGLVLVSEG
ncbi:MAG: DUF2284 domain-containing protein [Clostridiales bacterium]|nr:DUF2284 domain-containing protein [Clostridiales bacterium]